MSVFPLHVERQELTRFLVRHEIFKRILHVHGSIIEGGVGSGTGVMTWALLSSIYEPYNHTRRVIGFDTFSGFPSVEEIDHAAVGEMAFDSYKTILAAAQHLDGNRPIGHIPKIELVRGDATQTIPAYVEAHQHLVISLLYLDFDLYEPTKIALQVLLNRMPAGAIIAFDELNQPEWAGETMAAILGLGLRTIKLERCDFASTISWAQL